MERRQQSGFTYGGYETGSAKSYRMCILVVRKDFESLSQGVLGKIGDYDKNLTDLGVEIKAMERVFQKVLPSLTENVNKLERMAKKTPSK